MKAVILARGRGTRMRRADEAAVLTEEQVRAADAGVKAMIPFGRPFLDYVLSALADAGCRDICLIVGPEHDGIRRYYDQEAPPQRARVSFAVQEQPRGTADALLAAEAFSGHDPFLVLNSDNYYPVQVFRALVALDGPGLPAFSSRALVEQSNIDPERIASYALLRISPNGELEDIVEKPDPAILQSMGSEFFVSMNCWRFDRSIFEACRRVPVSPRGELELPLAVRFAVRSMGVRFQVVKFATGVLDLSHRADIPAVARRLAAVEARP